VNTDFLTAPGRRVVVSEYGETPLDAVDNYTSMEELPVPDPSSLRSTDVLISIRSSSVGWVDLLMASGQYQHMVAPPYCPGLEYSGVVEWLGAEVDTTAFEIGSEVFIDGLIAGPRSSGDYSRYGGYATFAVAPARAVRRIPPGFDFDQACNFLGSYETAYHCLIACGRLRAGETVLIHGASGSTGLAAVHVAKLIGATVIATGRSDDKLAVVASQGADHVINSKAADGRFRDQVKDLTGGHGVDVVYDGVGGAISLESLRCVKFGARFLVVGWAATPFVARGKGKRGAPNANMLPTNLIMMKGLEVRGCPTVIATQNDPGIRVQRLATLLEWVREGKISPHVSHRFPLDEYRQAMHAKWHGEVIGGCVLHPLEGAGGGKPRPAR